MIPLQELTIQWEYFTPQERKDIERAYSLGQGSVIGIIIQKIDSKEKEVEIQKIVNACRMPSQGFQSRVKEEMRKFLSEGGQIDTPQKEAEWQKRIDDEFAEWNKNQEIERKKMEGALNEAQKKEAILTPIKSEIKTEVKIEGALTELKGLPEKSVTKLMAKGITNQSQLFAMTKGEAIRIIGPLVAQRFSDRFASKS